MNNNGMSKMFYVHKLIALAFLPNPNNLEEVNHKDCNKLNNNITNLEWCDKSHNMQHASQNNLLSISHGKLTVDQVKSIRSSKLTNTELSKIYNISKPTISNIRHNKIWKNI